MKTVFHLLFTFLFVSSLSAQITQWRGPNRDGHFNESGLLKEWPENGPELLFEVEDIGLGYSSPVVTNNAIFITGMIDTLDYLTKISLDGKLLWQVPYGRSWTDSYPETRSSPTIEGNRVYVQSGTGRVVCINASEGKEMWAVEVDKKFDGEYHLWGNAESVLIVDDKVIASPGGQETSVIALNKNTGELIWKSMPVGGPRSYVSPTIYNYNDISLILAATAKNLIALNPQNGDVVWSYKYFDPKKWDWDQPGIIWTNTPVFKGDEIFLTKGYDYNAVMLKMDSTGTSVSEKYIDHTFDNHHHGVILHDDHLYGSVWLSNSQGKWSCMKWDTGEIKYVEDWDSKGSMVMADGLLYCYNERGNVGLVEPDPDGFEVISQFRIRKGSGPHWAHPYIANGKLYLRHGGVLMVYNVKA